MSDLETSKQAFSTGEELHGKEMFGWVVVGSMLQLPCELVTHQTPR